jgi:hypothetical protein
MFRAVTRLNLQVEKDLPLKVMKLTDEEKKGNTFNIAQRVTKKMRYQPAFCQKYCSPLNKKSMLVDRDCSFGYAIDC